MPPQYHCAERQKNDPVGWQCIGRIGGKRLGLVEPAKAKNPRHIFINFLHFWVIGGYSQGGGKQSKACDQTGQTDQED